jgi:hypothetical protein
MGMPPPLVPPAAARARAVLTARVAEDVVASLRHFILRELPLRLGVRPDRVAIWIVAGSDPVGLAVLRPDGRLVAVVGSKSAAAADPPGWLTARVTEIGAA